MTLHPAAIRRYHSGLAIFASAVAFPPRPLDVSYEHSTVWASE